MWPIHTCTSTKFFCQQIGVGGLVEVEVEHLAVAAPVAAKVEDHALVLALCLGQPGGDVSRGIGGLGVDVLAAYTRARGAGLRGNRRNRCRRMAAGPQEHADHAQKTDRRQGRTTAPSPSAWSSGLARASCGIAFESSYGLSWSRSGSLDEACSGRSARSWRLPPAAFLRSRAGARPRRAGRTTGFHHARGDARDAKPFLLQANRALVYSGGKR